LEVVFPPTVIMWLVGVADELGLELELELDWAAAAVTRARIAAQEENRRILKSLCTTNEEEVGRRKGSR